MESPFIASLLTLAFAFSAMFCFSLMLNRHYEQLTGRRECPPAARVGLGMAGVLQLAVALWVCLAVWGSSASWVAWCGFVSAGALLVTGMLPFAPRLVPWLAGAGAILGLFGLMCL